MQRPDINNFHGDWKDGKGNRLSLLRSLRTIFAQVLLSIDSGRRRNARTPMTCLEFPSIGPGMFRSFGACDYFPLSNIGKRH